MNHPIWRRKPNTHISLLILLILICIAAACTTPANPETSPVPTPESQILRDDFSSPNPAWALFDTDAVAAYVQDEELFLEDRGQGIAVYSPLMEKRYDDVEVQVQARHVQGSMNNWMGVICRLQNESNYYLLAVSADGYYLIQRVEDDVVTPLVGPEFSEAVNIGKSQNDIIARCEGNTFSLRVNDTLLVTRSDDVATAGGQIALFADAVDAGSSTVAAFDDLVLSTP